MRHFIPIQLHFTICNKARSGADFPFSFLKRISIVQSRRQPGFILFFIISLLPLLSQAQGYIHASTYLGGNSDETFARMQVVNGETHILGSSPSQNYPVTNGSTITPDGSGFAPQDMVYTKLDAAGNILFSTYIGGNGGDTPVGLRVVGGEVHILATTSSTDYPVTNGSTISGFNDMAYTKLDAAGNILFSTYIGGTGFEAARGIQVVAGEVHIVGNTSSTNYPVTNGSTPKGGQDIVYTKLDAAGNVITSTYLGGTGTDDATALQVISSEVHLLGTTTSTNYSVTNGSTYGGGQDMVYTKLNAAGTTLFSTYVGGNGADIPTSLQVAGGEVHTLGYTQSTNYPVTNGSTLGGLTDIVYTKLSAAGNTLLSTYIGGTSSELAVGFQVVGGEAYILGSTGSANYPVTNGTTLLGINDMVYTKLNAAGTTVFSTYIGGTGTEDARAIEVVGGEVHIAGATRSTDYLVTNGSTNTGGNDVVYTKLNAAGTITFSTYIGGTGNETLLSLQVVSGKAYMGGVTGSANYPVTTGRTFQGGNDIFYTQLSLCGTFPAVTDTTTPLSQSVCQNGFVQQLVGTKLSIPSSSFPIIYRNGMAGQQAEIKAVYQWQEATSPGGPWTDITGATQPNYSPPPVVSSRYYRRVSTTGPGCGNTIISISPVASVLVNGNVAPTVDAGGVINTCVGAPITLGGAPTATGGVAPYTYIWDNGAAGVANPTVTPTVTTVYTLTVLDGNGCQKVGQALVNAYAAYAGPDVGACAGTPVQIGGAPVPGVPGVTYSWAPTTGLSCTTCARPFATPASSTTYTLTMTLTKTGGGTCQTTDAVVVTPTAAPSPNFGGPDVVICRGSSTSLGTAAEAGFTYTWAPGNYLTANQTAITTFQPGSLALPTPDPFTYYVTALKNGCTFVDTVQAAVIQARAGVDGCGPRFVGEPDQTPNINETYTWTKISGPGNFVGPTNLPLVPVTSSVGGPTTYQLTVSYNGTTCTDQVVVPTCGCTLVINVQAPSGCPDFGLSGGQVALIASGLPTSDPSQYTFTWSPAAGLSSTTGQQVFLTDSVQRTYTVTVSSPLDASFSCTASISVNDPAWSLPVFTASDANACAGMPVQIGSPPVAGYSYLWTGANLSPTTISNPIATANVTTQYPVKVTDVGSGCITRDTVQVNVANVAANAGPDQLVCTSGTVQLGSPASPNTTYSWSPTNANYQNGTNVNSAQPEVLVAITTVFSVTATHTPSGCLSVDAVTVTVGAPIPSFTLPNVSYCPSSGPVVLGATAPTGAGYTYSWSPASQVLNPTSPTTPTINPPPSGPTTYTLTIRNTDGCEQSATQTIIPTNAPPNAGSNQSICLTETANLGSASNPVGAGISYSWLPIAGLNSASSPNPTFTPTIAGIFSFTVTKTEAGCSSQALVTVRVNSFTLAAIPSVAVCQGACITIGTTSQPGVSYVWSPAVGLANPNSSTTVACLNASTTYTLTGTDLNGCAASTQVLVGVNASPAPTINLPSVTACLGTANATFTPTVTPAGSYDYVWSPNNGTLSNIYSATPAVNVLGVGTRAYSLTVTNTVTGCSSTANALLEVISCCVKPNAGVDVSVCPPATTAQLTPVTAGGTWTAQAGNPASATVSTTGAVSGLTADGIYRFIYSVSAGTQTCTDTVVVNRGQPLSLTLTPGTCNTATNQYSIDGSVSLTNVTAGILTISDGAFSTTIAVSSGTSSVPFSLTGLGSGTNSHTVTASLSSCGSASTTYSAPASCTVDVALTVTDPGVCLPASNLYTTTGTISLTNTVAGTATITDGTSSTTVTVNAGDTTLPYSLSGLISGTGTHTVTVSYASETASTTYTAPDACTVGIALSVIAGTCQTATNQYSLSGTISLTNAVAGVATITSGAVSTTVTINVGDSSVPFSLSGLPAGMGVQTLIVEYAGQRIEQTYLAPISCECVPFKCPPFLIERIN